MSKLTTRDELVSIISAAKQAGKRTGFTSGVFDILHPGHVEYLAEARKQCDLLVVGLNSDASVKSNKGPNRPVCAQADRCAVLAGLESVDNIFIFDESNNNRNIELLKPDLYIKAGDYDKSRLSSAAAVESYGGKVLIVPMRAGHSSTTLIERIGKQYLAAQPVSLEIPAYEKRPAVFLDRDGVINEHVEYLHEVSKLKFLPGVFEALRDLSAAGFRIVVVTNQPGIGMGYFSQEDFFAVNREMLKAASKAGVNFDRIYYCPHSRADKCSCRKPGTALLERAVKDLNLDLAGSFFVGDMTSDIQTAANAGCASVLVKTGQGGADGLYQVKADFEAATLADAARWIITKARKA